MSAKTKIQWCDSTVNPTMGCDGCELWIAGRQTCYAGALHRRFGGATPGYAPSFEDVTKFPGRMAVAAGWRDLTGKERAHKPWLGGLPRTIFISDMSDSLSKGVSFKYLRDEIIRTVVSDLGQSHQWLWLTKRPERMAAFSDWLYERGISWPTNLWAGTSITTQATRSRIDRLLKVGDEKTIRFLSVEPQIEEIDLAKWLPKLDWVIQGGESGRQARSFEVEWAEKLIEDCGDCEVPYFLKQLGAVVLRGGERVNLADGHGGDWNLWPEHLRIREMPEVVVEAV